MSSESAISVNHVSKIFKLGRSGRSSSLATIAKDRARHPFHRGPGRERFHALDDVTFDVATGEVVGVIGRNGAGKSTLLKIMSRITPPSKGYIDLSGRVGSLLEVGTGFHPELTGIENVYLNGTILGMSKRDIDRRLDEIIAFAEVDRFLETPVKRYSSGMRVRLAFAVAAHLEPEILIVDEVLSVGDAVFQTRCIDKMRSVATQEGRTVMYVSHNLVTVENLCPRSLLLVDGVLDFDGETRETLSRYLNMLPHGQSVGPGVFDLSADRSGHHGKAELFTRLELRPNGGTPDDKIRMGERLQIEISVDGLDERPDTTVAVIVGSPSIQKLFRMTSRMRPLKAAHERCHSERIVLDIASLPLTPGEYQVNVEAYDTTDMALLDEVHAAAEFRVLPADVVGNAYAFSPWDGQIIVPWDWELRPGADAPAESIGIAP